MTVSVDSIWRVAAKIAARPVELPELSLKRYPQRLGVPAPNLSQRTAVQVDQIRLEIRRLQLHNFFLSVHASAPFTESMMTNIRSSGGVTEDLRPGSGLSLLWHLRSHE